MPTGNSSLVTQNAKMGWGQDVDPTLIGYWNFDESSGTISSATDLGIHGNNLIGFNSPTRVSKGPRGFPVGYAASLNGTNQYVGTSNILPHIDTYGTNHFDLTHSLWFWSDDSYGVLVDELQDSSVPSTNWHDSHIDITKEYIVRISVWPRTTILNLGPIAPKTWNHVILRYNSATSTLDGFLNGIKIATTVFVRAFAPAAITYCYGLEDTTNLSPVEDIGTTVGYFKGYLDEIRLYARPISDYEAYNLFVNGRNKFMVTNPIMWWKFESFNSGTHTIPDDSGNQLDLKTTASGITTGKVGSALYVDMGDEITVGDKEQSATYLSTRMTNDAMTVTAWFYCTDASTYYCLIGKGILHTTLGNVMEYRILLNPNRGFWWRLNGINEINNGENIPETNVWSINTWHHFGFVYDGTANEVRFYVDGSLVSTTSVTGTLVPSSHPVYVGTYVNTGTGLTFEFAGKIDDLRVYPTALTQSEIQDIGSLVFGSVLASSSHPTITSSAVCTFTDVMASSNVTATHVTITSSCVLIVPVYSGILTKSKSATFTSDGIRKMNPLPHYSLNRGFQDMILIKLNESTGARRRIPFDLISSSDNLTGLTGQTVSLSNLKVYINGGSEADATGTITEIGGGLYYYELAGGEVNTVGQLTIRVNHAGALPFKSVGQVVAFDPYDATRYGLSALPNAAASASGGLITIGTGAGQIYVNGTGGTYIALDQPVPATDLTLKTTQNVGDCLSAARAEAAGNWAFSGTSEIIYGPDGVQVIREFTLNDPINPTSRE